MIRGRLIGQPGSSDTSDRECNAGRFGAESGLAHHADATGIGCTSRRAGRTVSPFASDCGIGNRLFIVVVNQDGHRCVPFRA